MTEQVQQQAAVETVTTQQAGDGAPVHDAAYWETEAKKAFEARDKAKSRAKELEGADAELKKLREAQMTEQEKLAARLKEIEPKAAEADSYRIAVEQYLEAEVADIPESLRSLIPEALPINDRLRWLKDAKAKGLFAATGTGERVATGSQAAKRPTAPGGNTMRSDEFYALPMGGPFESAELARKQGKLVLVP